jgi:hypothetical protein
VAHNLDVDPVRVEQERPVVVLAVLRSRAGRAVVLEPLRRPALGYADRHMVEHAR